MKTIDFAIDLGTTNSLVAKMNQGEVRLFNNPLGLKQTLPSCIAFRGGRTVVGDKAVDYLEKDASNVCMLFKRKMGSEETYYIPAIDETKSPIDLSAIILRELKNFVGDEVFETVVITIPASFDTIQSNATKKAGYEAGFKEVVLLQEPIAACLAFANKSNVVVTEEKKWIVYDLGGGTFDVALVSVDEREIKVIDNAGDNFLGGADFDTVIVEKLIIPFIERTLGVSDLWKRLKQKTYAHRGAYFELLNIAEEAKKELSVQSSTEIELDIEIEGTTIVEYFTIERSDFEMLIKPDVDKTIAFVKEVIASNNLAATAIDRIILIGGSTYIPCVREQLKQCVGVTVDDSIDPTSAVVEGACYYAGSKPSNLIEEPTSEDKDDSEDTLECAFFYEQQSRDEEELITAKITVGTAQKYRITRSDGGYDSGIKPYNSSGFSEFVPLISRGHNSFKIQFLDEKHNVLKSYSAITITQGSYNVQGQPLPNDICMEIDDEEAKVTRLENIFKKGSILPLKKKIYKTASKSILKGSTSSISINIIEGKSSGLPSSGLSIGYIEITGEHLEEDLVQGTDIEIEIEVTESRELSVNAYLQSCDQEFSNIFSESERVISIHKIHRDVQNILVDVEEMIASSNDKEAFEFSNTLNKIRQGLIEIQIEASLIEEDDISDKKYQLDDQKRKLIYDFDALTRNKTIAKEIKDYTLIKLGMVNEFTKNPSEQFKLQFEEIIKNEKEVINSGDKFLIRAKIKELRSLQNTMFQSKDENFILYFLSIKNETTFTDKSHAQSLIKDGEIAMRDKNYKALKFVVYALSNLLPTSPDSKKFEDESKTGLK